MSEKGFRFRTAAFGGFRKEDVLAYLEQSTREHREKLAALQKELDRAQTTGGEAAETSAALGEQAQKLREESRRLAAELTQAVAHRDELEAQVAQLQGQVERLGPSAEAYEALKSRTAGIELEAHSRAQAIEEEGRQKAKKTQEQLMAWFDRVCTAYERMRTDLDATLSHARREMQRVNQNLEDISGDFESHDEALKAIRREMEEQLKPAPQPLPLEEEQ